VIAADRGYVFSLGQRSGICSRPLQPTAFNAPPGNIALSEDGKTIAFVEHLAPPRCGEDRIVILRGGRRTIVSRPDEKSKGGDAQTYWISRLRVLRTGNLLATVEDDYSGAIIGAIEQTYETSTSGWKAVPDPFPIRSSVAGGSTLKRNVELGDARGGAIAVNSDIRNYNSVDFIAAQKDPSVDARQAVLVEYGHATLLGDGVVTSINSGHAVGYVANLYYKGGATTSVLWQGSRRTQLGTGIAFGVDDRGNIVGDDRARLTDMGRPVLWRRGKQAATIAAATGSAFAVRDGTIVGAIQGTAFVARINKTGFSLRGLPDALRGRWTKSAAFAIAASGRILALAVDRDGAAALFVLDSQERQRN